MRALRVISPDNGVLLGHGVERVLHVRKSGAKARALLRGHSRKNARDAQHHVIAIAVELLPTASGELDEDDAAVMRVLKPPYEAVALERVDLLGQGWGGHHAAMRELTTAHRALAKVPHHAGAIRRHW